MAAIFEVQSGETEKQMVRAFVRRHSVVASFVAGALVIGGAAFAASFTPFSARETLQASKLNANFTALQDRIATLEANSSVVTASYNKLLPWTATAGNFATPLRYSAPRIDTHNAYNVATGVFTVPQGKAGTYMVSASAVLGSAASGGTSDYTGIEVHVNGAAVAIVNRQFMVQTGGDNSNLISTVLRLAAGDRVQIAAVITRANPRASATDSETLNFVTIAQVGN
jgi:hypothetical protein